MKKLIYIFILAITVLFSPMSIKAKEIECNYEYNDAKLNFKINNSQVNLPFKENDTINKKKWYTSADFKEEYIKSAKTTKNILVCPTITIEENNDFITVFVNSKDENMCNGTCTKINSINKNNINIVETKIGNAISIYKKDSYFVPQFRKLSDNSIEWSINNKDFYDINSTIKLKGNNIQIDKSLIKNIFTNNDKSVNIYRCVSKKNKSYDYLLSANNSCKNDLSKNDNQGYGSLSYNGAKGADGNENCKSTILGDPNDEENSVAWLLQHLLNYLKILGPMIVLVMSSLDFTKALISGDDETMQKCYKMLIKRLILALVLFFIPQLVMVLLDLFGITGDPICVLE